MKTFIAIAIFIMSWQPLQAGDFWLAFGAGVGSEGLAGHANGSLQLGSHGLVSIRWAESRELGGVNDSDDGLFSGPSFRRGANDFGILFGWVKVDKQQKSSLSVSAGVGSVTVTQKGEWIDNWIFPDQWDKEVSTTTGFLLQGQLFRGKWGFQAFADFNSIKSFGGVVVSMRLLVSSK
ncbi:MAG: hypothetical protein KOO62_09080 [candidate division Zixibacteria bacterium]|nr:hypothetical protein [candidate division Zixibacteria bacterium]